MGSSPTGGTTFALKTLKDLGIRVELVETKRGAKLIKVVVDDETFLLEQNPMKDSKYGVAYRMLKEKYQDIYFFWEFKNGRYTGRVLTAVFLEKEDIDKFISEILKSEEYKKYEDVRDEEEEE